MHKLSGDKLGSLLEYLGCSEDELENFGYYKTQKKNGGTPQERGQKSR